MEDTMLLYVLLFPTILNTLILLVMAVVLYRLLVVAGDLSKRFGSFLDRGEEELFSTTSSIRQAATQAANLMEKVTQVIDRYMFAFSMKHQAPFAGQKFNSVFSGLNIGYNVFKFIMRLFKKDD